MKFALMKFFLFVFRDWISFVPFMLIGAVCALTDWSALCFVAMTLVAWYPRQVERNLESFKNGYELGKKHSESKEETQLNQ